MIQIDACHINLTDQEWWIWLPSVFCWGILVNCSLMVMSKFKVYNLAVGRLTMSIDKLPLKSIENRASLDRCQQLSQIQVIEFKWISFSGWLHFKIRRGAQAFGRSESVWWLGHLTGHLSRATCWACCQHSTRMTSITWIEHNKVILCLTFTLITLMPRPFSVYWIWLFRLI